MMLSELERRRKVQLLVRATYNVWDTPSTLSQPVASLARPLLRGKFAVFDLWPDIYANIPITYFSNVINYVSACGLTFIIRS